MKRLLKLKLVLVGFVGITFVSGFGVLTYAESLKDDALVDSVVNEQILLGASLKDMYDSVDYNVQMIKDAEELLNDHQSTLRSLQMDIAEIKSLDNDQVINDYQALNYGVRVVSNRLSIFKLYNSLFESSIFNDGGVDLTVVVKDSISVKDIERVREVIGQNPQSDRLKDVTDEVLTFALDQLNYKKSVDDWLAAHGSDFTVTRQNELEQLIKPVIPEKTKVNYTKRYTQFKSKVNAQLDKEKKAKALQEASNRRVIVVEDVPVSQDNSDNVTQQVVPDNKTVQNIPDTKPAVNPEPVVPESRVDGFNFGNYHFDLQSFSGLGAVPQWTPYVYRWASHPSHYLFERASDAGSAVWNIGVGDTVTVDGLSFTVYKVVNNVVNDDNAYGVLLNEGAPISWQTCEENSPTSKLTIWFAR